MKKILQLCALFLMISGSVWAQPLSLVTASSTDVVCKGSNDGTISATVSGGTVSYTYLLLDYYTLATIQSYSTNLTSHTFVNIAPGAYYIRIIDSTLPLPGSVFSSGIAISEPATALSGSIDLQTDLLCYGASTAAVTVSGHDGWGLYTYNIDGGIFQSSGIFSGLNGGNHSVIIKDDGGCEVTVPVNITFPAQIVGTISGLTNVSCNGLSNGSFTMTASGGAEDFQIRLNSGPWFAGSSHFFNNLPANNYTVTIRDINSCSITVPVSITAPVVLDASFEVVKNLSCFGGNDAEIRALPTGGTAPYSYYWERGGIETDPDGDTGQQIGLVNEGGYYTVTVDDANGCGVINPVSPSFFYLDGVDGVVLPTQIVVNPDPAAHTDACQGQTNGNITVVAAGGTGTYTYSQTESGTYQGSNVFSGLGIGTYEVWVQDANSCKVQGTSVTIVEIPLPIPIITINETSGVANNDGIICNGASVTLTASGGTSYAWSTGAITPAIAINPSSTTTYTVTVTSNGCSQSTIQIITVNPLPTPAIAISETSGLANNDGIICSGASVTLTASGGTSYAWSTGAITPAITVNPASTTTYTVTVTNANNCSQPIAQSITVNPLPTPIIAISETSGVANNDGIICNGASVILTASGGTSYAWSTGAITPAITVNPASTTTYTVTVTNANNCSQSTAQIITVNPLPTPAIAISETSGVANNDGIICNGASVTLTASGGTSYAWSTGAITPAITINPASTTTYTVTVTSNGCSQPMAQIITVNPLPTPAIAISETSGVANNDGIICNGASVTLTASGGTSYAWSTGAITPAITINPASTTTYTVTVTNANNCSQPMAQIITVNPLPTPAIAISETSGVANNDGIICNGASVTLTASGGTSYAWSTGAITPAITVNPASTTTYTVTVTSNGCTQATSQIITVNPLPTPAIAISETSGVANNDGIICNGASVTLTASGGTSYAWSTGAITPAITINPASTTTYTVTVTSNGCTQPTAQIITVNPLPTPAIAISETSGVANNDGIICNGASVTLTASGGASYAWSTGAITPAITVNPASTTTYTVTVTNANNCTQSTAQIITVNPLPTPAIAISETSGVANNDGIICNGASVTLTASGGSSYAWSTGAITPAITVNPASTTTYTVTVTNANNCTQSTAQIITVNPLPIPAIAISETSGVANNDGIICNGASVTLTASGGASYAWSTGAITPAITVNPASTTTYTVTVTNANNCTQSTAQIITVNPLPTPAIAISETSGVANNDGIICNGASVTLTASGGASYAWSTGAITPAITVNPASTTTYTVTVTNANNCTQSTAQIITVNPLPTPVIAIIETSGVANNDGIICNGASVTLTASGGTSYVWSTGAITPAITINPASTTTYTVTVTSNGCTQPTAQIITVNPLPTPVIAINETSGLANNDGIICSGASVTLTASGGTSYAWSTGAITPAITINPASTTTYTVTVTNANNCTQSTAQIVTVNPLPTPAIAISETSGVANNDGIICNGASVTLTASGGASYAWSTGAITPAITVNPASTTTYTVTVTNANNCTQSTAQIITVDPLPTPAILISETSGVANNDGIICDGASVTLTASGGSSYAWSTGAITPAITINPASTTTYTVTVTNAGNCTQSMAQIITVNPLPTPAIAISETSGVANDDGIICDGASVTLTASGGTSYAWSTGAITPVITINPATTTTYTVTVTNANNCTQSTAQIITVNPLPTAAIAISETSGVANNDGIICDGASVTLTASGGTSYAWSTGEITPSITVNPLITSTYTVTVTSNGCSQNTSQIITVNPPPVAVIAILETSGLLNNDGIICDGDNVTLTASGGTSYAWSTGETGISIGVSPSVNTSYSVTVTDAGVCSANASQLITVNALPVGLISVTETSGITNNDGFICEGASATLTASGGTSYSWSTGETTPAINVSPLASSSYDVTITNANGCSVVINQNINVNALPLATIGIFETSGLNNNDGIVCDGTPVMLTAGGGLSYNWSTGETTETINLTPTATGIYTVTVTNADGCVDTENITITVNPNPNPALSGPTPVCQATGGNVYTTDPGMSNYIWNIPAGGVVTAGGGIADNTVTIRWDLDGTQTISVNYSNANNCPAASSTQYIVTVEKNPIALAGPDAIICYDATYQIPSASVANEITYLWKTLGDGKFENGLGQINDVIAPVYTSGDADKLSGSVKLVLQVTGAATCNIARDTILLTIPAQLQAAIGAPKPFDIDASTRIQVHIKTSGHRNIGDLGYYLVAPDGLTTITLKAPAAQPCNTGYDADVTFDSQSLTALNICSPPAAHTVTGTYMAEGAWNALFNNFNPAEGGWAVQVRDVAKLLPLVSWPQGNLVQAEITFTSFDGKIVNFNSGAINIPINNGTVLAPAKTSFIVPLGLRTKCSTSCDATAVVNVIGGTAPFAYAWNDPSNSINDTLDLCQGTFSVTVTDAIGCTSVATVNVTSPPAIILSSVSYSNNDTLKCYGETTDITIQASGGTGALKYTYAGAPAPNDTIPIGTAFSGLGAGTYNFRILDLNNCTKDTTIYIVAPDTLKAEFGAVVHNHCYNGSVGSIVVRAKGGNKKYIFTIKQAGIPLSTLYTMEDTAQFTGLAAGSYTIAVRDTNSCIITPELSITITQPPISLTVDMVTAGKETTCALNDDGWAKFNVSGGALPLTYMVFNSNDTVTAVQDSLTGIPRGTYTAMVTDNNGCEATYGTPVDILSDPAIIFNTPFTVTPVTKCFYNSDGTITVSATHDNGDPDNIEVTIDNQTGTYNALIAPGYSFQFTNLSGGWHRIYAKDIGNPGTCVFIDSAYVASPAQIVINPIITFVGANNYNVDIVASGGTGTLEYALLDNNRDSIQGFGSNHVFTGLTTGSYYALVRDDERCVVERAFDLADFTVSVTHLKCYGDNSGRIQIHAGASGIYLFDINNGAVQNDSGIFVNLSAGKYYLRVYNQSSTLVFYDSTVLNQPASPMQVISLAFPGTLNICSYDENVSVRMMVKAVGGIAPYQYSKDGLLYSSDPDTIMYGKGTHTVFVRDTNACVIQSLPILVTAPDPVVISYGNLVPVKGSSKGSVELTASGPGKPMQFSMDQTNWYGIDSTYTFTGLDALTYPFYAINSLGCRDTINITIPVAQSLNVNILIDTTRMQCFGDKNAIMSLIITDGGVDSARFYITGIDTTGWLKQKTMPYTDLGAGNYSIYVEDNNGRVFVKDTVIPGPAFLSVTSTVTDDKCSSYSDVGDIGAIVLNMPSDYSNYVYTWSNNAVTKDLTDVNAGDYTVTITYGKNNACSLVLQETIHALYYLDVTVAPIGLVCPNKPFTLSATASTIHCTYQWVPSNGLSDPNISNPEAIVSQSFQYIVVVTDTITGCNNNAIVPIDVEDLPDIFPTPDTIRVAQGGQQLLMANEGYVSYSWTPQTYLDNPEIAWPTVFPIEDIVYFVTGISPAGCIVTDTVVINMANLMIPSGFTPNGDGVNDVWEIDNAEDFPGIYIEIYNRWGQKVFLQAGYSRATAFDGTRNGKDLPIGTYYYVVYLNDKNPLTGTVTIVR